MLATRPALAIDMGEEIETVLVVEDDESFRELFSDDLKDLGKRVITAASPEAAWEIIQRQWREIDLAFLDVDFGANSQKTGFDLAEWIQSHPEIELKFFIMSMIATEDRAKKAEEVGAIRFLEKDYDNLIEAIKSL